MRYPTAHLFAVFSGVIVACSFGGREDRYGTSTEGLTEATLVCNPLQFTSGRLLAGQSAATLATRQLTGTQDVWASYVEFAKGAAATCTFTLPAGITADALAALSVRTNYKGPRKAQVRWVWEAWSGSSQTWMIVADNGFAADWRWTAATIAFPAPLAQFVTSGQIRVRYRQLTLTDASDLDEWVLVASVQPSGIDAGVVPDAPPPIDAGVVPDAPPPVDAGVVPDAPPPVDAGVVPDAPPPVDAGGGPTTWWKPAAGTSWDWQLAVPIKHTNNVSVYDIDLFENPASEITALHAEGRKVICYVDFGSWEDWRPDAAAFPASVKGATYHGFSNERWLDIRRFDVLAPIMLARLDLARSKGCDGIEPDNIDGYDTTAHESSGFPLTYDDQLRYNRWIAAEAHARGMAVGLKNDIHQTVDLVGDFDYAVSEQCFQYGECQFFTGFIAANKPVFECEYKLAVSAFCPQANAMNFSSIKKRNSLNGFLVSCR